MDKNSRNWKKAEHDKYDGFYFCNFSINWISRGISSSAGYVRTIIFLGYNRRNNYVSTVWSITKDSAGYVANSTLRFGDTVFRPSWGITVIGYLPFVGNIANLGCALHSYKHGETGNGHEKLLQAVVGTLMDIMTCGSTTGGLKMVQAGFTGPNTGLCLMGSKIIVTDFTERIIGRVGAFSMLKYFMNHPYHKY